MTSGFGRRAFSRLALLPTLKAPAVAGQNDDVDLLGRIGGRRGPHTPIILDALREAQARRVKVIARAGTYILDDDIPVDWSGLHLEGEGEATRFVQAAPGRGFLRLGGEGHVIRGIAFICDYERQRLPGRWRGYAAFQRVCAVWAEGGNNLIEAVSGQNSFGVVCLRGPVLPLPVGQAAPERAEPYDYTGRARGNRVRDIAGRMTDFVLTGNQQEDLLIDGVVARGTTALSVPPHAIYMQNPGSTRAFCGFSLRVRARRLDAQDNPHSEAFRFSDIRDLTIEDVRAKGTVGGLTVSTCDGVAVRGGEWSSQDGSDRAGPAAVRISQSARVRIEGGKADYRGSGVVVYNGSEGVDVDGFAIQDRIEEGKPFSPFRVGDTSEARFVNCRRERNGADRPMFVVVDQAVATIEAPACARSSRLVHCGPEARVHLSFDPARVDGWDPRRSLSGARERMDRAVSPDTRRAVRPLPGAPDNACPSREP
ncbi:hypothetical protein [Roseomonas indoligenes]|uniref:Uncharacterized protein n=1 Tax=Roseomonas indoligenes TaxID=2820811 RepID=A0A940N2B5_9PROT|nr:hypothetical protein [Pararoseomonas indoligenes]MBP0495279.1 hypothetical protein [Pararoseomonas indoligenes]